MGTNIEAVLKSGGGGEKKNRGEVYYIIFGLVQF